RLERCLTAARDRWGVQVYLEPGEAVALNAGFLVSRVLDAGQNGDTAFAILDASAACHMPDVLEMPYRPPLFGADDAAAFPVRLGGPTCLSGDVIGDYRFAAPLREGDLLCFGDMAIYTTCKNNTFNGMPLLALWLRRDGGALVPLRSFGYDDFKARLGSAR
ncbi:MAG: carboxynorspermidine decarboxylase, partial [bacterium]|nr:carboxynorspermidine decarboxylase [bacterium]